MGSEFCPLSLGWISPLQSSHTSTSSTTPLFLLKQPQPRAVRPKMAIPPEVEARLGPAKDLEGLSDADLKAVLKEYYDRWVEAESQKYDVERDVHIKDMQIHDLEMEVSDMRGKFILPKLKNKFETRFCCDFKTSLKPYIFNYKNLSANQNQLEKILLQNQTHNDPAHDE